MIPDEVVGAVSQRARAVAADHIAVAYSGGLDSSVLLHMLTHADAIGLPVTAVHIDHGLQRIGPSWRSHVETTARALGVPLSVVELALEPKDGESVEAVAREGRYRALAALPGRPLIVLAQHRNDQAETLLLQLLRGAGPKGLAAMAETLMIGRHAAMRPLLAVERATIHEFARSHDIAWFDDPSNDDQRFDRNFLRAKVMPAIRARWPSATATIARSASLQAEAVTVLTQQATTDSRYVNWSGSHLSASRAQRLPASRQRNLIRFLIDTLDAPMPSMRRLAAVTALVGSESARGEVRWADVRIRRYRDLVFIEKAGMPLPKQFRTTAQPDSWVALPGDLGRILISSETLGESIVTVRLREGGERVRPRCDGPSLPLARWFQEHAIPPWHRQALPLVEIEGCVAAVGETVFEGFDDLSVTWERPSR